MDPNLLDKMLDRYQAERTNVTVTLQNRIRISGRIRAFDSYVIMMENQKNDILFRHAVSSLAPASQDDRKRPVPQQAAAQASGPAPRPTKTPSRKPRMNDHSDHKPKSAPPADDKGISNTMKDGLLRWMQEQKTARK